MILYKKIDRVLDETKVSREQKLHQEAWQFLIQTLNRYYGIQVDAYTFKRDSYGKPYLIQHPEIHFNISHCEEMVACVIGTTDVGIDIEKVKAFPIGVMKKVCDHGEQEDVKKAQHPEELFFRLWTLKESYIKAVGKGLQLSMKSAVFHIRQDGKIESNQPNYTFRQKMIEGKYILSVCEQR